VIRRHGIGLDDAEADAAPRQVAGQHETRGTGSCDQNIRQSRHSF
jgi:hypothetical protein